MKVGNQHVGPTGAVGDQNPATGFDSELLGTIKSNNEYQPPDKQGGLVEVVIGEKPTLTQGTQYPVGIHNKR